MSHRELKDYYARNGIEQIPVSNLRLLDGGPAIKSELLNSVRRARDYILVDSFLLSDGVESRELLEALTRQHRRGVRVYIIGDSASRFVPEPAAFEFLERADVPHAEFNPIISPTTLLIPRLLERDHRKFWIIDGKELILGGANLNDISLAPSERGGNLDLMVRFESKDAIAEMIASFVQTWNDAAGAATINVAAFPVRADKRPGGSRLWLFNQNPFAPGGSNTETMMTGLWASAKDSVWLIQPYTFVNSEILAPVRQLVERGVDVNLVLSTKSRAGRFLYASYFGIRPLQKAGAKVWLYESEITPLHYKCALIDTDLAYVGSANLNWRSYHLAREVGVVLADTASVTSVRKTVRAVRNNSRIVTPDEANGYRTLQHFVWWALMHAGG